MRSVRSQQKQMEKQMEVKMHYELNIRLEDTTYYVEVQVTPTGTAVSGMESNPDDCLTAINTAKQWCCMYYC